MAKKASAKKGRPLKVFVYISKVLFIHISSLNAQKVPTVWFVRGFANASAAGNLNYQLSYMRISPYNNLTRTIYDELTFLCILGYKFLIYHRLLLA